MTYKIIRFFASGKRITLKYGLTLEEAQKYCKDPETSSKTATKYKARVRTREHGEWFDGYAKEEDE